MTEPLLLDMQRWTLDALEPEALARCGDAEHGWSGCRETMDGIAGVFQQLARDLDPEQARAVANTIVSRAGLDAWTQWGHIETHDWPQVIRSARDAAHVALAMFEHGPAVALDGPAMPRDRKLAGYAAMAPLLDGANLTLIWSSLSEPEDRHEWIAAAERWSRPEDLRQFDDARSLSEPLRNEANGSAGRCIADALLDLDDPRRVAAIEALPPRDRVRVARALLDDGAVPRLGEHWSRHDFSATFRALGRQWPAGSAATGVPAAPPARASDARDAARAWLDEPQPDGARHRALAASLITLAEGVALRAYADPARGAGQDIGTGYNLRANRSHLRGDMRAAGVAPEIVERIAKGKPAALTPEQSRRLTAAVLPRYEEAARRAAESRSEGLWDRMPHTHKAVMIDLAWQVGDPSSFPRAWDAIARGDDAALRRELRVHFVRSDGTSVEDGRRQALRQRMLGGESSWRNAVLNPTAIRAAPTEPR